MATALCCIRLKGLAALHRYFQGWRPWWQVPPHWPIPCMACTKLWAGGPFWRVQNRLTPSSRTHRPAARTRILPCWTQQWSLGFQVRWPTPGSRGSLSPCWPGWTPGGMPCPWGPSCPYWRPLCSPKYCTWSCCSNALPPMWCPGSSLSPAVWSPL